MISRRYSDNKRDDLVTTAIRSQWLNLEHEKKGSALVVVRCLTHFAERSEHAVRLRLIDTFNDLRTTLLPTGVRFQLDQLMLEERAILATVPFAELKLFRAFLSERGMDLAVIKALSARGASEKPAQSLQDSHRVSPNGTFAPRTVPGMHSNSL